MKEAYALTIMKMTSQMSRPELSVGRNAVEQP